jgi:hypothetical protein
MKWRDAKNRRTTRDHTSLEKASAICYVTKTRCATSPKIQKSAVIRCSDSSSTGWIKENRCWEILIGQGSISLAAILLLHHNHIY